MIDACIFIQLPISPAREPRQRKPTSVTRPETQVSHSRKQEILRSTLQEKQKRKLPSTVFKRELCRFMQQEIWTQSDKTFLLQCYATDVHVLLGPYTDLRGAFVSLSSCKEALTICGLLQKPEQICVNGHTCNDHPVITYKRQTRCFPL